MKQTFHTYISEPKRSDIAHLGKRIVAYLIDHILVVVAIVVFVAPLAILDRTHGLPEWIYVVDTFFISIASIFYLFLKDAWDGRGIGKRAMGLQVVDFYTNAPVNWKIAALRYLVLRVLNLVELIFIFVQPNHRGIGDWLGHSVVVERK